MTYQDAADWYNHASNEERIEFLKLLFSDDCYFVSDNTCYLHPITNEDVSDFWERYTKIKKGNNET